MIQNEIRELLDREPFEPFRLRLTSGDSYEVRSPGLAVLMRSQIFLAFPKTDRWTFVSLLHVAAVEKAGNGRSKGRRPRGGRGSS